jgi:hypothetical protein
MKQIFEYDKVNGSKCEVWKNSPSDPRSQHSGTLEQHICADGKKIQVCPRCKVDMENLKNFLKRKPDSRRMAGIPIRDYDEEQRIAKEEEDRKKEVKRKEMEKTVSHDRKEKVYLLHQKIMLSTNPSMTNRQISKAVNLGRGIVQRIGNTQIWHELHPKSWLEAEKKYRSYLRL